METSVQTWSQVFGRMSSASIDVQAYLSRAPPGAKQTLKSGLIQVSQLAGLVVYLLNIDTTEDPGAKRRIGNKVRSVCEIADGSASVDLGKLPVVVKQLCKMTLGWEDLRDIRKSIGIHVQSDSSTIPNNASSSSSTIVPAAPAVVPEVARPSRAESIVHVLKQDLSTTELASQLVVARERSTDLVSANRLLKRQRDKSDESRLKWQRKFVELKENHTALVSITNLRQKKGGNVSVWGAYNLASLKMLAHVSGDSIVHIVAGAEHQG